MKNIFFQNQGPFKLSEILNTLNLNIKEISSDYQINDVKDLINAEKNLGKIFNRAKKNPWCFL